MSQIIHSKYITNSNQTNTCDSDWLSSMNLVAALPCLKQTVFVFHCNMQYIGARYSNIQYTTDIIV